MNTKDDGKNTAGEITALPRRFKIDATVLEDPNPSLSPEEVIAFYAQHNPKLNTGHFGEPILTSDAIEYTYETKLGVKGAGTPAPPDFTLMEEVSAILLHNDEEDIEAAPSELLEIV